MLEFLRIVFFAKTILLTPEPITLLGDVELRPQEPVSAVTPGAGIEIDVSSMFSQRPDEDVVAFRRRVVQAVPAGSLEGKLIGKSGSEVTLRYAGTVAVADKAVFLTLAAERGVPIDEDFDRIRLKSSVSLTSVRVSWRNAKH